MNEWAWCVSRIVVHPLYRGIGLGKKLLSEALRLSGKPYVELVAVMARYNPFAEKAGMIKVCEKEPDEKVEEALRALEELGLDRRLLASERYVISRLGQLGPGGLRKVRDVLVKLRSPELKRVLLRKANSARSSWPKALKEADLTQLARLICVLASMALRKAYLIWRNPAIPYGSCPLDHLVRPEWHDRVFGRGGVGPGGGT